MGSYVMCDTLALTYKISVHPDMINQSFNQICHCSLARGYQVDPVPLINNKASSEKTEFKASGGGPVDF